MAIDGINGSFAFNMGGPKRIENSEAQKPSKTSVFTKSFKGGQAINMSSGWSYVSTDPQGNKVVVKYNDTGSQYTEKHYQGDSDKLYTTTTYDALTKKIVKKSNYDFISGKLYQEQIYTNKGRIERHYDDDGAFSGESRITNGKNGKVKIENYDANGKKTGYSKQKKIGTDEQGRTLYEVKSYDAKGKLISKMETTISIGVELYRE